MMPSFSPKFRRLLNIPNHHETQTPRVDEAANDSMHQSGTTHAGVNEHYLHGVNFDPGLHRQMSTGENFSYRDDFVGVSDSGENVSIYATCHTIDDCMWGLHTCLDSGDQANVRNPRKICDSDYDWILDGDNSQDCDNPNESEVEMYSDEIHRHGEKRQQRIYGDEALDNMLGMMELENSSFSTGGSSACNSLVNGDANFDYSGRNTEDEISADKCVQNETSFADFSELNDAELFSGHFEQECALSNDDIHHENNSGTVIKCKPQYRESGQKEKGIKCTPTRKNETCSGYVPPASILDLVSDLDKELNVTIEQCLASPPDSTTDSVGGESECPISPNSIVVAELDLISQQQERKRNEYKQPLLMSETLLKSLPIPLPNGTADLEASFTRRIQKNYASVLSNQLDQDIVHMEDEILQQTLSETIHKGYFRSDGKDCDSFDSIVLDEILNIPWPFDTVNLDEPILEHNEDSESDFQEDALNFDTFILNRLSQLDSANGEIMSCILSRVNRKEHVIKDEVEQILAAELEISAAAMCVQSGRDFLKRAIGGYATNDCGSRVHNPITGGLDILQLADQQDRIRSLLDVVDRINAIRFQEAKWWDEIPNTTVHQPIVIPSQRFHPIIDEAKKLMETARGEEVICHIDCLQSMRDRINRLPDVLLVCIQNTFANLLSRILTAKILSDESLDQYFCEYQTLLHSWIAACSLVETKRADDIAKKWTGCVLEVFSFEIRKALASAVVDANSDDRLNMEESEIDNMDALGDLTNELQKMVFSLNEDTKFKPSAEKIVENIIGRVRQYGIISCAFFHLCSRLVEIMGLYCALCEFSSLTLTIMRSSGTVETPHHPTTWNDTRNSYSNEEMKTDSKYSVTSSVSSDETSSASFDSAFSSENTTEYCVPESFELKGSVFDEDRMNKITMESICINMDSIRHPLWKCCESILAQLLDLSASSEGPSISSSRTTEWLHFTHNTFKQFTEVSRKFLQDDNYDVCNTLDFELSAIYRKHLRSVHIDAMKGTGTLLRHDPWELSPLDLPYDAIHHSEDEKKCVCDHCDSGCSLCISEHINAIKPVYTAVEILVTKNNTRSERIGNDGMTILTRSYRKGYLSCVFFKVTFDTLTFSSKSCDSNLNGLRSASYGLLSKEFSRTLLPFIEKKACGHQIVSLITQSWANGLVKWTSRLLTLGNMLPTISSDVAAAVTTLFDLYILTVFRICSLSKINEDVLIGFGRGSSLSTNSNATRNISMTMEADVCAPLPGELGLYEPLRSFISNGRRNLENIVNLDKFQSINDTCPASPRSKKDFTKFAKKLERESAAAHSCLLAAVLIDVASNAYDNKAVETLTDYSISTIKMVPFFVQQACRSSCVHSISGKELIFQIMCVGRAWEEHHLVEHSNVYVDELVERCSFFWGNLSSSLRMPPPALRFTWEQLVWVTFMTLLEGFSKVPHCSTEGRSLMSMDLATLSHGLHPESVKTTLYERQQLMITTPSDKCREEIMRYVDTFIKVFYFPDEDVMNWIKENFKRYHFEHSLSLITARSASGYQDKGIWTKRKDFVREIYFHHEN